MLYERKINMISRLKNFHFIPMLTIFLAFIFSCNQEDTKKKADIKESAEEIEDVNQGVKEGFENIEEKADSILISDSI